METAKNGIEDNRENGIEDNRENISLFKNSKSYNWRIKINAEKKRLSEKDIERLENLNKQIKEKWGEHET